eukprot:TRINITY_DN17698_c0_g1_i1.p1 TRINITY_DN17698_c0_g1~~TRINITY_DN17698_c0_g1_i1.p1  ORF type:complete len:636 (-),score=87.60 TRINITY_DN17698_c0_g1_i1:107-2014(-)
MQDQMMSTASMLEELSGGLSVSLLRSQSQAALRQEMSGGFRGEFLPAMAQALPRSQNQTVSHSCGINSQIVLGAAAPCSRRNEQNFTSQVVQGHIVMDQAHHMDQQSLQIHRVSIPVAFPNPLVTIQSYAMADPANLQNQQQRFSNRSLRQTDPFEEFVLFDQPIAAQCSAEDLPEIQESEHHQDSQGTGLWNQPGSQKGRLCSNRLDVELHQNRRTDPRHVNMAAVVKSSPSSSPASNGRDNAIHIASRTTDVIHPIFPEAVPDVQSMPLISPTDPAYSSSPGNFFPILPRSKHGPDGAQNMPVIPQRSPTVPASTNLPHDAPFHAPRSWNGTDTVSNMQQQMSPRSRMLLTYTNLNLRSDLLGDQAARDNAQKVQMALMRSLTDSAGRSCSDMEPLNLPRSQTGSTQVPFDVPRTLSDQTSISCQEPFPSIESLAAMTHQLLQQAENICDRSRLDNTLNMTIATQFASSSPIPETSATWNSDVATVSPAAMEDVDDLSASDDSGSDYDVLVGPTELLSAGLGLKNLALPAGGKSKKWVPLMSCPRFVALTDGIRLARAQSFATPLSFGSTLHLMGQPLDMCRPCMFEQRPGRCKKSFCCDFCHVGHHRSQARKTKNTALAKEKRATRSRWATT